MRQSLSVETAAASFPVKIGGRGGGQAAEVGRQPGEGRGGARGAARPSRTRHPGGVLGGVTRGVRRQRLGLGARKPRAAVRVIVALVTQVARRLVAGLVLEGLVIHHFKVLPYVLSELPIQSDGGPVAQIFVALTNLDQLKQVTRL